MTSQKNNSKKALQKKKRPPSYLKIVRQKFLRSKINKIGFWIVLFLFSIALFADLLANNKPYYLVDEGKTYYPIVLDFLPDFQSSRKAIKNKENNPSFWGRLSYPAHQSLVDLSDWLGHQFNKEKLLEFDYKELKEKVAQNKAYAIYAPIKFSPNEYNLDKMFLKPQSSHWLGTDEQGRDVLSRLIHGSKVSLKVGFIAVGIYVILGLIIGSLAGFFGGKIDFFISRFIEIMMCFPTFFLIIAILALIDANITTIMLVIGFTGWTGIARLTRGEFFKLRSQDFVLAAKSLGLSSFRVIFRHILPNTLAPVMVSATFGVASAILIESSLSFLGFGVKPGVPSWGAILSESREFIDIAWWLTLFPGVAIFLTITSFNLVGEGLRDATDPKA